MSSSLVDSSAPSSSPPGETVVIVGNGMVGWKLCARLVEHDATRKLNIIVFGEEPRPAYDRVQLTAYFSVESADDLLLANAAWYADNGIDLRVGQKIASVDTEKRSVQAESGEELAYDHLVLATGSSAFVPPIPGVDKEGVHVYRTIEDLDGIMAHAESAKSAAVLGGGLLGLEAARAVQEQGLETHVIEMAPRLMPRQLDDAGARLLKKSIEAMNVSVHLGMMTAEVLGEERCEGLAFRDADPLDVDMVVVSAGIRPRDELAREAGIEVGPRGGIVVDDQLRTSAPDVYCVGEAALYAGMIYGLVAPGYEMADVVARTITGSEAAFTGADLSAKLKLMGTDVASFGDPFAETEDTKTVELKDLVAGVYKKILISECGTKLLGGILVGDAKEYGQLVHLYRTGETLPESPDALILPARGDAGPVEYPDSMQVCSCNNITKGDICGAIAADCLTTPGEVKSCTTAGGGCGGCMPLVAEILDAELLKAGTVVKKRLCEHFDFTRQELFDIVKVTGIRSFDELLARKGEGSLGCEVCKPTAGSIFASVYNDMILADHATLQDTNDRFLANIQRQGTYSVVPRIAGGEITPDKLIVLGEVAKKYDLYTKITGGQRIDLFGARLNQLPDIWEDLVAAGFESGHAYAKGLRTVKSCVGSTWCRMGQGDSVSFAIRLENRYKGIRSPHKLKSAVSGCVRECAEAQSKDFGLIATENGYNLYLGGNGGAKPRHADLVAADIDEETCIKYIDRFLMFYINTADKLMRTARWVEKLDGGIEYLKQVIIEDSLGIAEDLERQAQALVDSYACEWTEVVKDAEKAAAFRHFANTDEDDEHVEFAVMRDQHRVVDWPSAEPPAEAKVIRLPIIDTQWVDVGAAGSFPENGGMAVRYGDAQLAVYNVAATGEWYASENKCPHKQDMVLARGILGDKDGEPKVACPMHKKNFSLKTGECISGESYKIHTFPAKVVDGRVMLELPPADVLSTHLCGAAASCTADAAE